MVKVMWNLETSLSLMPKLHEILIPMKCDNSNKYFQSLMKYSLGSIIEFLFLLVNILWTFFLSFVNFAFPVNTTKTSVHFFLKVLCYLLFLAPIFFSIDVLFLNFLFVILQSFCFFFLLFSDLPCVYFVRWLAIDRWQW